MNRVIGFAMIAIAIGMIIKMFIQNCFVSVLIILALLIVGYNLFMCGCKKKKCK